MLFKAKYYYDLGDYCAAEALLQESAQYKEECGFVYIFSVYFTALVCVALLNQKYERIFLENKKKCNIIDNVSSSNELLYPVEQIEAQFNDAMKILRIYHNCTPPESYIHGYYLLVEAEKARLEDIKNAIEASKIISGVAAEQGTEQMNSMIGFFFSFYIFSNLT